MSVSNMYFDGKIVDCSVNWQIYSKQKAKEELKPEKDQDWAKIEKPAYDLADAGFQLMVKTIALSTTSFFQYTPDVDEIRARVAKVSNFKVGSEALKELAPGSEVETIYNREKDLMIEEEGKMNYIKRAVKGDASETGLVKFSQPVLMKEYGGEYEDGLNDIRKAFPPVKTGLGDDIKDGEIPFSSDIKFNLLIRDANQEAREPSSPEDNITVYIKGAPEKILNRCSHILENGGERVFDDTQRANVDFANDTFGGTGERVLAFAKLELDPSRYNKGSDVNTPGYQFDVSGWKAWNDVKEYSDSVDGWFPMWDFRLCGLASLNDPPRPKVDVSVQKCKNAGIKVIMVTGDQPPTAAAIAFKVNIITQPHLEYDKMVDAWKKDHPVESFADQRAYDDAFAIAEEDCMKNSKAIVIHGDKLAKVMAKDDAMEDDEIEKGRTVMDWIRKPEVVFARTTPSQKLIIVDACQRLGHVVAVTGDGVNDSPAIKKADIGIAMGSGSEVAQNAADMLLLDDNFSSIVNGVEEGRLIFDNLKKSIAYTLSSNIPEISPFIIYMAAQVPLPLSTVLILCIDLGTDMVPAISFAYENPELDIMERYPRNSQRDHLVNAKLISFAYLQIGIVQASAGFFTYFYMLNDYGFRPETLFGLIQVTGFYPAHEDVYDPSAPFKGNSVAAFNCPDEECALSVDTEYSYPGEGEGVYPPQKLTLDWNTNLASPVDARLFYFRLPVESWVQCRWNPAGGEDFVPKFYSYSVISNQQICFSTEALKYAQSGYLISIVCVQWSDLMICKTRNLSISQQGMVNMNSNFALFFETALVAILSYVWVCNLLLGTRMIAFPHFAVPSFAYFAMIMFYDEVRKVYLRRGMIKSRTTGRIKFDGWVVRNTYY